MQVSEENKSLIEHVIQSNEFYVGNEHLFEQFYKEILRRTYLVLNSKTKEEALNYLEGIAPKIINNVIEREKTSIEYKKMLQDSSKNGIVSLKSIAEKEMHKFDNVIDFRSRSEKKFLNIEDPIGSESKEKKSKSLIQRILEAIYLIHQKDPLKYYFQIFYLKYYAQMKQEEIAKNLNITQSELSLRFVKMLEELKDMGIDF